MEPKLVAIHVYLNQCKSCLKAAAIYSLLSGKGCGWLEFLEQF